MQPLKTGVAYHGNRMPHHAREDFLDMARNHMNLIVHMFSHTDWDRHKKIMKEIIEISESYGLEVWIDNWGIGGPPGDKSHFLQYHPEAHQYERILRLLFASKSSNGLSLLFLPRRPEAEHPLPLSLPKQQETFSHLPCQCFQDQPPAHPPYSC